jgi:FlaA1/EpsC-like NDP-sugar epimerase
MMFDSLNGLEILITGGCGSLGQTLVKALMENCKPRGIRLYNRDEGKTWLFLQKIEQWRKENPNLDTPISFCIGDVRDKARLSMACNGANVIIHAAAMKQLPCCEENPIEAIQTNIIGTQNVITSALENKTVFAVYNISSDKSCMPINLYGATKMVGERLIVNARNYSKGEDRFPRFYSFRYGNIIGSKGSVVQLFSEQIKNGKITITDENMTRFWITLKRVANFILYCISKSVHSRDPDENGIVFIPNMPSSSIMNIARIMAPKCDIEYTGIRPGEKLHEDLIHQEESLNVSICDLPDRKSVV